MSEDDGECMHGLLEEHLNLRSAHLLPGDDASLQLDLLLPIRERKHPQS